MDHVPPGHEHDADAGSPRLGRGRRPGRRRAVFAALLILAAALFAALGAWQVERRAWKLALIDAVDSRAHAAAVLAPGPGPVTAQDDSYRHVRAQGTWLTGKGTRVQALTELGAGHWLLTPLRTAAGWTVLVNRGFVPPDRADPAPPDGPATVTGLLRITEPGGGFLRSNDPASDHWYSRDVAAIAAARDLGPVVPYFIDADATPNPGSFPVGGLTVIAFPNSHLIYSITWFGLCGLSLFGLVQVLRAPPRA